LVHASGVFFFLAPSSSMMVKSCTISPSHWGRTWHFG